MEHYYRNAKYGEIAGNSGLRVGLSTSASGPFTYYNFNGRNGQLIRLRIKKNLDEFENYVGVDGQINPYKTNMCVALGDIYVEYQALTLSVTFTDGIKYTNVEVTGTSPEGSAELSGGMGTNTVKYKIYGYNFTVKITFNTSNFKEYETIKWSTNNGKLSGSGDTDAADNSVSYTPGAAEVICTLSNVNANVKVTISGKRKQLGKIILKTNKHGYLTDSTAGPDEWFVVPNKDNYIHNIEPSANNTMAIQFSTKPESGYSVYEYTVVRRSLSDESGNIVTLASGNGNLSTPVLDIPSSDMMTINTDWIVTATVRYEKAAVVPDKNFMFLCFRDFVPTVDIPKTLMTNKVVASGIENSMGNPLSQVYNSLGGYMYEMPQNQFPQSKIESDTGVAYKLKIQHSISSTKAFTPSYWIQQNRLNGFSLYLINESTYRFKWPESSLRQQVVVDNLKAKSKTAGSSIKIAHYLEYLFCCHFSLELENCNLTSTDSTYDFYVYETIPGGSERKSVIQPDHPWSIGLTKYSCKYRQTYDDPEGSDSGSKKRYSVTKVVIKIAITSGVTGLSTSIFSSKLPEQTYAEDIDIAYTQTQNNEREFTFTFTPKNGKSWDIISRDYTFKIKGDVNFILETGVKKGYDFSILNVKYQKMNQSSVQQLTPIAGG